MKNATLWICPIVSNGGSTGFAPIHVRMPRVAISVISIIFLRGLYFVDVVVSFFIDGVVNTAIDMASATTPPSLDGIDRQIA